MNKSNKSPLRYPGGKTRACKKLDQILDENTDMDNFDLIVSPFFGGGSFEFHLQNKYNKPVVANDKFTPLYNFWNQAKTNNKRLCQEITKRFPTSKKKFTQYRKNIMDLEDPLLQAVYYFIINRCSFSGATLSGGFSLESSIKRFTKSSIERVNKLDLELFEMRNEDFSVIIGEYQGREDVLMFLDPPYYLEKGSKLYGNKGDMHETFDHVGLCELLKETDNWFLTYNNCDYIKELYKDYKIIETNWSYGMNASKKSSEIVILNL